MPTTNRTDSIDAARGMAMLFVCLSHFGYSYFWTAGAIVPGYVLTKVGMVASPAFVILSGILLGYLYRTRPESFASFRRKLVDRGVFLLVVGHALLLIPSLPRLESLVDVALTGFVTDAIAVAIILGPPIVMRTKGSQRLAIAFLVYVAAWALAYQWVPHPTDTPFERFVRRFSVGRLAPGQVPFPIFPWLGVYLAATVLGERLGVMKKRSGLARAPQLLAGLGAAAIALGLLVKVTAWALVDRGLIAVPGNAYGVYAFVSPWQKFPPGPTYLLFFGGLGLLLIGAVMFVAERRLLPAVTRRLATVGEMSLVAFFLQAWIIEGALPLLHLPYTNAWPLLFALCVGMVYAGCVLGRRHGWNEYLTLGVSHLLERRRARRAARHAPATPGHATAGLRPVP